MFSFDFLPTLFAHGQHAASHAGMPPSEFGLAAAFLLGLFGGLAHCPAMCGGFAAGVTMQAGTPADRWRRNAAYQGGRVLTYGFIGASLGLAGALLNALGNNLAVLQRGAVLIAGLFMVFSGVALLSGSFRWNPERLVPARRLANAARRLLEGNAWPATLKLGLVLGFLPCGLVYSAAAYALAGGSPVWGFAIMLAFGVGTIPALLTVGWMASILGGLSRYLRWGAGCLLVVSGLLYLVAGFPGA